MFRIRIGVRRLVMVGLLSWLLLAVLPGSAQDAELTREPLDLAQRLLDYAGTYPIPAPTPLYAPGDETEFWLSKVDHTAPTRIKARLAASAPNIYVWVEEGLVYDEQQMNERAAQLEQILNLLRLREVYGQPSITPGGQRLNDPTSLLAMPDIDNDPHLFIVFAADLGDEDTLYNFNDSIPVEIAPGGYSNQHELIAVNVSVIPNVTADDPVFLSFLTRAIYEMLANYHTPDQAQWLKEALSVFVARQLEITSVPASSISAYIDAPDTSLIQPSRLGTAAPTQGAQQLFFDYLIQRVGIGVMREVLTRPGDGVAALDAILAESGLTDPLTGEPVNMRTVFADFVMANVLNTAFGDRRFEHSIAALDENQAPGGIFLSDQPNAMLADQTVNQFGSRYIYVLNSQPTRLTLRFEGHAATPRLAMPAGEDADNRFYWSGRGRNQSATLTRSFDLTGLQRATLSYDVWFDLANEWNYTYIQVSADDGASWDVLATPNMPDSNRFGLGYGRGYTGISNPEGPRPFPIMGIIIDSDAMTISEVVQDGPAHQAGLRAGDRIIGYEGQEWPGMPNVIALLSNYAPGDTLSLLIERGSEQLDVPVLLAAHPTRVIEPAPLWLREEVDLSAYAGKEILLRFEYVSLPDQANPGIAIDNIALVELNILDDAEGSDSPWTLNGWQQVGNQVQQRFVVQAASSGSEVRGPGVRQLIAVGEETTSGKWQLSAEADEVLVIAISALNDDTDQPAAFSVTFEPLP